MKRILWKQTQCKIYSTNGNQTKKVMFYVLLRQKTFNLETVTVTHSLIITEILFQLPRKNLWNTKSYWNLQFEVFLK